MATTINTASNGSGSGYTVSYDGTTSNVTITSSGTYIFTNADSRLVIRFTVSGTNVTIQNSTFNRQTTVYFSHANQFLNFNNITSYSTEEDDTNIDFNTTRASTVSVTNSNIWVWNYNEPVKSGAAKVSFTNTNIHLAYYNDAENLNEFTYQVNHDNMCKQCNIIAGMSSPSSPMIIHFNSGQAVSSPMLKLSVLCSMTVLETIFDRTINLTVPSGKTVTFDTCELNEYHFPSTGIPYDNHLLTLSGEGNIFFTNSIMRPRINQSKRVNSENMVDVSGATYSQVNSDSTLRIRHLPSIYGNYDTLYDNVSYVKNATIDVLTGDYVFGTEISDTVSFDLKFDVNDYEVDGTVYSPLANVTVYVDGGNVSYANNSSEGSITWSGIIVGRSNQDGGRGYTFNTDQAFDISGGLIIVANGGNNILDPSASQGTWTGTTKFSYYPVTNSTDFSYNLMLENSIIVGNGESPTPIPLYNGAGSYWYNFYANDSYRPKFYFGKNSDSQFDLSAGNTAYINFKNAEFYHGVDICFNGDENITSYGSLYDASGNGAAITLSGDSSGSFTLNFEDITKPNNVYLYQTSDKVFQNDADASLRADYNNFHLRANSYDFCGSGLSTYKDYISTDNSGANDTTGRKGVIYLNGTYNFSNVPDLEYNFFIEQNSTIQNTTFKQTIYVWGPNDFTIDNNIFKGTSTADYPFQESSVAGSALVNLSSLSDTRVFQGNMNIVNSNEFFLPHDKRCVFPYDRVNTLDTSTRVILTSNQFTYVMTSLSEPVAYNLAHVYLDNAIASDVTIFGGNDATPIEKEFTVTATGTNNTVQYLTGKFLLLNLDMQTDYTVSLGYPANAVGRSTQSGTKVLSVNGAGGGGFNFALNINGNSTAQVSIENVAFEYPGSYAFFRVNDGANGRIHFTSESNTFSNESQTFHIGFLETTGSSSILDLGSETIPVPQYNQLFWPTLGSCGAANPLISTLGYVAESWTNEPSYYSDEGAMYLENNSNGLSKPYNAYGLGSWNASQNGYDDVYFYVAFGLEGSNTLTATLDHSANFETYVIGAFYDTDTSGVKVKNFPSTQYRQTIRLRFVDNFTNLAMDSRTVTATLTQSSNDLWTVAPVPLYYYINSFVSTTSYSLTTQVTPNGGANWYDVDENDIEKQIRVSSSLANGSGNIRFQFKNGSNVLRFINDTSMNFAVDISFIVVGPDTDLNDYVLSWPALEYSTNTLEIQPLAYGDAWTTKNVTTTHQPSEADTNFLVHNIDDDTALLASSTSDFTGVYSNITFDVGNASYNINEDTYTFSLDFYVMSHVLVPNGTTFDPLVLDTSAYINGLAYYPTILLDVSGSGTTNISSADVATPVHVDFTLPNSDLLYANTDFSMSLILDDLRNQTPGSHQNPINTPVTATINFTIPLYVYVNTQDFRTDQTLNSNISKGNVYDLYVYLSSKLSSDFITNFTLMGDNVEKFFSVTVSAGDISASGSINIVDDYKIWGDASLSLSADQDLYNNINYSYSEARSHSVQIMFGRALDNAGYESSASNMSMLYEILPATGQEYVRTPSDWNQGNAAGGPYNISKDSQIAHIPITKYTPYFVEVQVASKGFYSNDVNTDIAPSFTIQLTNYMGGDLVVGTDYIINNRLSNVNGTTSSSITDYNEDSSANKRLYFRLTPTADLQGDTIGVKIVFNSSNSGTNYNKLVTGSGSTNNGVYHIANIDYTSADDGNMSSTLFLDSAGLRANTWRILPSGDGKYLEFYHDSTTHYITRLGLDASFHPFEYAIPYYRPGGNFNNGHQIQNYVAGQNGNYTIYDPVNDLGYTGYVVHGFGTGSELTQPWLVIVSTDTSNNDFADFGQGSSDFYDMPYSSSAPSGNGIYQPFKYFKGASKVGLVTGSLTSTTPSYWKTFALTAEDSDWNTGAYSFYDALYNTDQFLENAEIDYTENDNVFQEPSLTLPTAEYSGVAEAGNLTLTRTGNDLGNGTQELNYFVMTGDFYHGDNDIASISFINRKPSETQDVGGNDDYHNSNQLGTKWTFWNNDFCCDDTNTSRIGNSWECLAGLIDDEFAPNESRAAFVIVK